MDNIIPNCTKFQFVIPDGLRELISDISREVLRSQPTDLYTFIADYLDALLLTRENARVASRLVTYISHISILTAELLEKTGLTSADVEQISTIIRSVFRRQMRLNTESAPMATEDDINVVDEIMSCVDIPEVVAEEAAEIIQRAYEDFKKRHQTEKDKLYGLVDWRVAARSAIHLYRKTGVTKEEADRAATLIKSAYKGYYTRRKIRLEFGPDFQRIRAESQTDDEEMEFTTSESELSKKSSTLSSTSADHYNFAGQIVGNIVQRVFRREEPKSASKLKKSKDSPKQKTSVRVTVDGKAIQPSKDSEKGFSIDHSESVLDEKISSYLDVDSDDSRDEILTSTNI